MTLLSSSCSSQKTLLSSLTPLFLPWPNSSANLIDSTFKVHWKVNHFSLHIANDQYLKRLPAGLPSSTHCIFTLLSKYASDQNTLLIKSLSYLPFHSASKPRLYKIGYGFLSLPLISSSTTFLIHSTPVTLVRQESFHAKAVYFLFSLQKWYPHICNWLTPSFS